MKINKFFANLEYGTASESTGAAEQWLAKKNHKLNHYIDGAWVGPSSAQYIDTFNSADTPVLARVADGTAKDTDRAVAAAKDAQATWADLGEQGRENHLFAIGRKVQERGRVFSGLESMDRGDSISPTGVTAIPAGAAGVIAQIIPPNTTFLMTVGNFAAALAAGNTVVLKPAGFSSCTAVLLAQCCHETGLPRGVFNLLLGFDKAEKCLLEHPDVKICDHPDSSY